MSFGERDWVRIVGGGCFINAALTGLLVGFLSSVSIFSANSIVFPFLAGATISFGLSLFLVRSSANQDGVMRKVILAGAGVLLGSICAVLGITLLIFLMGS